MSLFLSSTDDGTSELNPWSLDDSIRDRCNHARDDERHKKRQHPYRRHTVLLGPHLVEEVVDPIEDEKVDEIQTETDVSDRLHHPMIEDASLNAG